MEGCKKPAGNPAATEYPSRAPERSEGAQGRERKVGRAASSKPDPDPLACARVVSYVERGAGRARGWPLILLEQMYHSGSADPDYVAVAGPSPCSLPAAAYKFLVACRAQHNKKHREMLRDRGLPGPSEQASMLRAARASYGPMN